MTQSPPQSLSTNELGPMGKLYEPPHILDAITRAMSRIKRQQQVLTWTGLPGRGKTLAALRLYEYVEQAYPAAHQAAHLSSSLENTQAVLPDSSSAFTTCTAKSSAS